MLKIKTISWFLSLSYFRSIKKSYQIMSSFLDLPNEIILKVLSYTEITDIVRCGQVSKRIRTISNDNSLFRIVNLSGKYVTTDFIEMVLNKGCRSLDISHCNIWGNLSLMKISQLRKLDLSNCRATTFVFERFESYSQNGGQCLPKQPNSGTPKLV